MVVRAAIRGIREGFLKAAPGSAAQPATSTLLTALFTGAAYYTGAQVGFAVRYPSIPTSIIWLPNAILMAALMLSPVRRWWVYLLCALLAHLLLLAQSSMTSLGMLGLFVTNAGEAALAAYPVRRLCGGPPRFTSLRHLVIFLLFAIFIGPFVTSFPDAAIVVLAGRADDFALVWQARFWSNVLSVLTLVPAVVLWATHGREWLRRVSPRRFAEACLLGAGLLAACALAFSAPGFGPNFAPALLYLPLLFLIWAALRFGPGGVSTSLFAIVTLTILFAIRGQGPFTSHAPAEAILGLQLFLIAVSVPILVLAAETDERHQTIEELRASEARNNAILRAVPDLLFLNNAQGVCLDFYARDHSELLVTPEHFLGKNLRDVLPPELARVYFRHFEQALKTGEPQVFEYELVMQGKQRWYEARVVRGDGEKLLTLVRDVTERRQAGEALKQLTGRVLKVQDEERRRIARELHDTTAQNLLAIVINLETLLQKSAGLPEDFAAAISECQSLCQQTQAEIRTLSYLLHPPMLDEAGLVLALESFIEGFSTRTGISVAFAPPSNLKRLPQQVEMTLFRIVQESLTNIYRHSGSKTAEIRLYLTDHQVRLEIKDYGRAAVTGDRPPPTAVDSPEGLGVGIAGMKERARQLGGRLNVRSGEGGTTVIAVLPVEEWWEYDEHYSGRRS